MTDNEYIIETITLGNSMKVTAVDPESLKEVSIIAPLNASREEAAELAIRKLNYMLNKKS